MNTGLLYEYVFYTVWWNVLYSIKCTSVLETSYAHFKHPAHAGKIKKIRKPEKVTKKESSVTKDRQV